MCTLIRAHGPVSTYAHKRAGHSGGDAPDLSRGPRGPPTPVASSQPQTGRQESGESWVGVALGTQEPCPLPSRAEGSFPPAQGPLWGLRAASPCPGALANMAGVGASPTMLRGAGSPRPPSDDCGRMGTLPGDGCCPSPGGPGLCPPARFPSGLYSVCPDLPSSPIMCPRLASLSIHRVTL